MSPRERAFYLRLGCEMREARTAGGWSLYDVAAALDVSHVAVSRWERGLMRVSAYNYQRVRDLLTSEKPPLRGGRAA